MRPLDFSTLGQGHPLLAFPGPLRKTLCLRGPESRSFLHSLITQDVAKLETQRARRATLTDRMAKIVAPFWVLGQDEGLDLIVPASRAEELAKKLKMFVFGAKVEITEGPESKLWVVVASEGAGLPQDLPGPEGGLVEDPSGKRARTYAFLSSNSGLWLQNSWVGPSAEVYLEPSAKIEALLEGVEVRDQDDFDLLRILAGEAEFGVDYGPESMPPEVGLGEAVHYHKGCYTGQEILERLRSRGKETKRLVGISVPQDAEEGDILGPGAKVLGQLTSPIYYGERTFGLAILPVKSLESTATLTYEGAPVEPFEVPASPEVLD